MGQRRNPSETGSHVRARNPLNRFRSVMYSALPASVRFEHGPTLGVGTATPRLSWTVPDADPGFAQDAYEIEVTRAGTELVTVESGEQVPVPWPVAPLASRESATVRVRVRGGGDWSGWSEPATVEAGLLESADWVAGFIG